MAWRKTVEESRRSDRTSLKGAMRDRVMGGTPVGILGYLEDEPVALCSVAPRSTHRRLVSDGSSDDGAWSITCFFVMRKFRGVPVDRVHEGLLAGRFEKAAAMLARRPLFAAFT